MPPVSTPASRGAAALLWAAAFVMMLGAAAWQRTTGPTYPKRGLVEVAGQDVRYRLVRSSVSGEPSPSRAFFANPSVRRSGCQTEK